MKYDKHNLQWNELRIRDKTNESVQREISSAK